MDSLKKCTFEANCADAASYPLQDGYSYLVDRRCALLSGPLRSTLGDTTSKSIDLGKNVTTKVDIAVEEPPTATSTAIEAIKADDPDGYVNPFASNNDANEADDKDRELGLEGGFAEARSNRIVLPNMRGIVLEKVVEYLCWYGKYQHAKDVDIPKFEPRILPEIALEL